MLTGISFPKQSKTTICRIRSGATGANVICGGDDGKINAVACDDGVRRCAHEGGEHDGRRGESSICDNKLVRAELHQDQSPPIL